MVNEHTNQTGLKLLKTQDLSSRITTQYAYPDASTYDFQYNNFKQRTSAIDRLGRQTQYVYDTQGNRLSITQAVGTTDEITLSCTYNSLGQKLTDTDANGNITDYIYNVDVGKKVVNDIIYSQQPGTYILANGRVASINLMLNLVQQISKKRVPASFLGDGTNDKNIVFDRQLISNDVSVTSLEESIRLLYSNRRHLTA